MLRRAKSKDNDARDNYRAKASFELEKAKQSNNEYEWLFWEWKKALEPLMKEIATKQRESPDLKYMKINYGVGNVRTFISWVTLGNETNRYDIECGSFETPRKFIRCNIETNKEEFRRFCVQHYEWKFQQSLNSLNNIFN